MKVFIGILLFFTCAVSGLQAQNTFIISGGMKLVTSGNVQLVLNQNKITNNGSISGTGGTWVFKGPVILEGTGTTQVPNLVIDHSFGITQINAPLLITNQGTLVSGNMQSNSNLTLGTDPTGAPADLSIAGIPSGNIQGLAVSATTTAGACPSFVSNLSINISGTSLQYQWQSSLDSTTWNNVAGATNATYAATVTGPVYYRCNITAGTTYNDTAKAIKLMLDLPNTTITGTNSITVGQTATLTGATPGGTWSSNNTPVLTVNASSGLITGIGNGAATVTYSVTNASGCTSNSILVVNVTGGTGAAAKPNVVITNPAPVCAPATVNLTAAAITAGSDPGLTYSYYTNAAGTTAVGTPTAITQSGTYYIKGTNSSNVSSDLMPVVVTVNNITAPKANFSFDSYCINRPVTFTNTSAVTNSGPVSYLWTDNNGNTSTSATSPVFTYTQAVSYNMKLKVTSQTCPGIADSITQAIPIEVPRAAVRMQPPTNVLMNEPIALPARNFGKAYAWSPATGLDNPNAATPNATLTAAQEYRITITAPSGCITVDTLAVWIFDNRVYVPSVFTPNGDGVNDKLYVNVAGARGLRYFRVYNRYGKLMFQTSDPTVGWDGRFNGELQPIDTYVWTAEVADSYGAITRQRGNVTLLR